MISDADLDAMAANHTLINGISKGDPIRVDINGETYEGQFHGVMVNRHHGLVLVFTHVRVDANGHEIACETSASGAIVRRLERLGPASRPEGQGPPDPPEARMAPDELRGLADGIEAEQCTGLAARWCPTHGNCVCPPAGDHLDDPACPLHQLSSSHAACPPTRN